MSTTNAEWIATFAARLGIDAPSDDERDAILALAGVAAHASDRTAAPVACWLAAKAGVAPKGARALALQIGVADADDQSHPDQPEVDRD